MEYASITTKGINQDAPLIYKIEIHWPDGLGVYVGQSVSAKRPLTTHLSSARAVIKNGYSYHDASAHGGRCQEVHFQMAEAFRKRVRVTLTLIENCTADELQQREAFWMDAAAATLNRASAGPGGKKSVRIKTNRMKALEDVLKHPLWRRWKSANGQRWGSAGNVIGAVHGKSQRWGCNRLEQLLIERDNRNKKRA